MAVHWANLLNPKCHYEFIVLCLLCGSSSLGLLFAFILIIVRYQKCTVKQKMSIHTFLMFKLISMYVFGFGFMFRCGLYAWKRYWDEICPENSEIGLIYNIITILYTGCLFLYFALFHVRKNENTFMENFCSLFILLANVCVWLDAILSESSGIFNKPDNDNSSVIKNVTENRATEVIEKTESFLSPALIEFSLLGIDLLFTKTSDNNVNVLQEGNLRNQYNRYCQLFLSFIQILICLFAFSLFAFTFLIVLKPGSSNDYSDYPDEFLFYVCFQFIIKFFMICLILICIILSIRCSCLTFHLNVSTFILLVACFGNVVYHTLYCFALDYESKTTDKLHICISWADNIISLVLAPVQTIFIIGIHSSKNNKNILVVYFCSFLGVLNLGLWVSDSIGEERLPVFSLFIFKAFQKQASSIINKIILPLTIFFRFHTGFEFLEIYWTHS